MCDEFLENLVHSLPICLHYNHMRSDMQQGKRHLRIIQENGKHADPVKGMTCFSAQERYDVECNRKSCQNWIAHKEGKNCAIISAQDGPYTLQKIGQIYGVSRMRICQMEKEIFEKIRSVS